MPTTPQPPIGQDDRPAAHPKLNATQQALLDELRRLSKGKGSVKISHKGLSKKVFYAKRTVYRNLLLMEDKGILSIRTRRRADGGHLCNEYTIREGSL